MDPCGAQEKVREIASSLGLSVSIAVAHETFVTESGTLSCIRECQMNYIKIVTLQKNHYCATFISIKVN